MKALIESFAEKIVIDPLVANIYFDGSTDIKEYFKKHKLTSNVLFSNTLAVLDDLTERGDYDLMFTTYGIVPVKSGVTRPVVKYSQVKWLTTKKLDCLEIDGKFDIFGVDSRCLFELCTQLREMEQEVPRQDSVFKLPDSINPFKKPN